MPIRRELRWLYPIDWKELSLAIRFGRAGGRCERCRRPHGEAVWHLGDGRWWDAADEVWRNHKGRAFEGPGHAALAPAAGRLRRTRVVLAAAHRDHDPGNNRLRNLMALCQRCHLTHDRAEHLRRRRLSYLARYATGDLFAGRYRP